MTSTQRRFPSLFQSSAGATALVLALLSAPLTPPVHAQSCTPDPFGGETCLPDPDPMILATPMTPAALTILIDPMIPIVLAFPSGAAFPAFLLA